MSWRLHISRTFFCGLLTFCIPSRMGYYTECIATKTYIKQMFRMTIGLSPALSWPASSSRLVDTYMNPSFSTATYILFKLCIFLKDNRDRTVSAGCNNKMKICVVVARCRGLWDFTHWWSWTLLSHCTSHSAYQKLALCTEQSSNEFSLTFLFFLLHIKPFSQIFEGEHTEGWKAFQVELVINLYRTSSGSPLSTVLDKSAGQFVPKNKNDWRTRSSGPWTI